MGTVSGLRWVVAMLVMGTLWGAEAPSTCAGAGYGALTWASGKFSGSNVHAYSAEAKHWLQLNVDNHGHVHAFEGTANDHGLEYSGVSKNEAGGDVLNRMDIAREGANRVKVWWRKSADSGKTWTTAYEAIYVRMDSTK